MTKFTPIYNYNDSFLEQTNTSEYWYVAGLLAADGYITKEKIELCLNSADVSILNKIRDIVCPDKKIYVKPKTNARMLKLDRTQWALHYKELFSMATSKKHKEIKFPEVPEKFLKDFVRGYFDGDGCVDLTKAYQTVNGIKKSYVGFRVRILGNEEFLLRMMDEIRKQVPNNTRKVRKKGTENVFEVTYNFSTAKAILQWMYSSESDLFLSRKREKYAKLSAQLEDIV